MSTARIMVVDDQSGMLRAVKRILEGRSQVSCFSSPREALAEAPKLRPDLAILDVRIPEMDGFEVLRRLKSALPDIDVILMTGSVTDVDQKMIRAIRDDAFYFIQKPFDAELLRTLVDRCLQRRSLRAENRAHLERLERELREARAFQESMLPPQQAEVHGIDIACRYVPCSELGGDFYDYGPCGEGGAAVIAADVSGHGASAAMLTGLVKSAFASALSEGEDPAAVASAVASAIRPYGFERFISLVCVCIHPRRGELIYANAGHPPALLWSATRAPVEMGATGTIISPALPDATWESRKLRLSPGDRLLLYTDGLGEASSEHEDFGTDRVRQILTRWPGGGSAMLDALLAEVARFRGGRPPADDLTVVTATLPD